MDQIRTCQCDDSRHTYIFRSARCPYGYPVKDNVRLYCWWNISKPNIFLSLSGGVTSVFVMSWVYFYGKSPFSFVGVSICAAYTHTLTTVICVYFFWVQQEFIFKLLPVFFMFTLIAGILTGITGNFIVKKLTEREFA